MEIKTKFNVGDKVWFVNYDKIDYDCPICGEETFYEYPCGVMQGEIRAVRGLDIFLLLKSVRVSAGQCAYTDRSSDRIYATKEEAEQAYADELYKYEIERRVKRQELLEWIKEHYGVEVE